MLVFEDQFVLDIIIAILLFAAFFLGLIIYLRLNFVVGRRWRKSVRAIYQTFLAQYVNARSLEEANKIKKRIIKISTNRKKKQILLNELMDITHNFSGIYAERAQDLYKAMKLYELSLEKLYNQRWNIKIEGISELSVMGYQQCFELLISLLDYPEVNVRRHAKVAIVELHKIKGIQEIARYPSPMSEWTYISILSIMHRHPLKIHQRDLEELKVYDQDNVKKLVENLEKFNLAYS